MVPSPPKISAASGWSAGSSSLPQNRFTPGNSNRRTWCSLATGPRRATARTALLSHSQREIQNRDSDEERSSPFASDFPSLFNVCHRERGLQSESRDLLFALGG